MLLSDYEIQNAMERGEIEIDPFDPASLGSNSYDLHLAGELKVYKDEVLDPQETPDVETVTIPDEGYVLERDRVYLAATREWTRTDYHVPVLEGKSSLARLGVSVVSDGGFGDVGFEGAWTLELSVKQPVRIHRGMEICQISYLTTGACEKPYDVKQGARYSGSHIPRSYETRDEEQVDRSSPEEKMRKRPIEIAQCKNADDLPMPNQATPKAAGVDLYAAIAEPKTIQPSDIVTVPTGIKMALPTGFEAQVRPRSGLAQEGLFIPNTPGTIDADYRGEIKVILANCSEENEIDLKRGDRIAQLVVKKTVPFSWQQVNEEQLGSTKRGESGFGSTGQGQQNSDA